MVSARIELVKADALRRLRPYLEQSPSFYQRKRKARREEAIRRYLAEIVQAQFASVLDSPFLPSVSEMPDWLDEVLADAVSNAREHADVAGAATQHRESLLEIVRCGLLAEVDLRQRRWAASGMGSVGITPEMLAEEAAAWEEIKQKAIAEGRMLPDGTLVRTPQPEPEEPPIQPQVEPEEPPTAPRPKVVEPKPPPPPPLRWQDISVIFISDERVQVMRRNQMETFNYAEMGFADGRNGKPDRAWIVLRELARQKGLLPKPRRDQSTKDLLKDWDIIGKRVQTIRDRFRKHFGIKEGDPITFSGTAYQTSFRLDRAPSCDF